MTACAQRCVDTQVDRAHCGGCDAPCGNGEICAAGDCAVFCGGGLEDCSGSCTDTRYDPDHCGGCGIPCSPMQACLDGLCRAVAVGRIETLTAAGCSVIEHNTVSGDDRGGIAVGPSFVHYRGDSAVGRFDTATLASGTPIGTFDALTSDLATGRFYALSNAATPWNSDSTGLCSGAVFDRLLELNPATGQVVNTVMLTQTVNGSGGDCWGSSTTRGMYAGWGYMLLVSARTYRIDFQSGVVADLGPRPVGGYRPATCENWAHWGVAEFDGTNYFLVYAEDWDSSAGGWPSELILRTRVSDGVTTTAATFTNLSDMCSITVLPALGRWYFHFEGGSQFGSGDEQLGYCNATFLP